MKVFMTANQIPLYGNEGIVRDGRNVGQTTSGHWGPFTGLPEALGFVSDDEGVDLDWIAGGRFEVDAPGGPHPVRCEFVPMA